MKSHRHSAMTAVLTGSVSLLAALPALAGQGSALPCSGTWVAHGDSERPLFSLKRDVEFEMQVHECGSAAMLYRIDNGEEVVLERTSRAPNTYVWTQAYAGRTIGWRLVQQAPNSMTLVFFGDGEVLDSSQMEYLHPLPSAAMALLAAECEDVDDKATIDDPKTPEAAQALVREKQAVDTLLSIMRARDMAPPAGSGLTLRDYVSASSPGSETTDEVQLALRMARDGSLLPDPDAYSIDYQRCVVDEREYEPADNFLYFEIIPVLDEDPDAAPTMAMRRVTRYSDGTQTSSRQPLKRFYFTHATQVDVETGNITRAQDAGDAQSLSLGESLESAWQEMELESPRLDDGFSESGAGG